MNKIFLSSAMFLTCLCSNLFTMDNRLVERTNLFISHVQPRVPFDKQRERRNEYHELLNEILQRTEALPDRSTVRREYKALAQRLSYAWWSVAVEEID
ncbi:MAG: hypothetical protein UU47_C0003G0051 [candidate division TM6 bacterium GW2011_GWE2_41_16]|nr:MAG: hypothetical protein UU47_C0003G0051 [candidate division TM6 bacterium GW2011_GWE2_41_16]